MSPVGNLSPRSKALMLVNEYQQQSMGMPELRKLFQEICPTDPDRRATATEIEEVLRQARYSPADIWKLLDAIYPERSAGGATPSQTPEPIAVGEKPRPPVETPTPAKAPGKRTEPVKSPFIKSFEDFSIGGKKDQPPADKPEATGTIAGAPPGADSASIPTPTTPPAKPEKPPAAQAPAGERKLPIMRDTDKTAYFGASLKGISLDAVQPTTKARVLVADDDQRIRFVYRTKLEENGYTVIEAENGMEAWRLIQTGEVDIAILDMKMPGYHGLDVLGRMADADMDMPVIISTAYDQLSDEFVVATYPRLEYLVKPIDPNELLQVVEAFAAG